MAVPNFTFSIVDDLIDAAVVVDRELDVLHFNSEFLTLTGLRRREVAARRGLCHAHIQLRSCAESCIATRVFETGRRQRLHEIRAEGIDKVVDVNAIPITSETGFVLAVIEQYRDVTAENRVQDGFRRLLEQERAQNEIIARQARELEQANALLRVELSEASQIARTDGLTGVANRRYFDERFAKMLAHAAYLSKPLSVLMFDLDFFKRVNDVLGHAAGDRTLQDFARILRNSARDDDIVARYGGEEFVVVLPGASGQEALKVADRVQEQVRKGGICTTTSGGMASFPGDALDCMGLLAAADQALYAAKNGGRNRVLSASELKLATRDMPIPIAPVPPLVHE